MGIADRDYMRKPPPKHGKPKTPLSDALKTDPTGALASASGGGAFSNVDKNQSLPLDAILTSH